MTDPETEPSPASPEASHAPGALVRAAPKGKRALAEFAFDDLVAELDLRLAGDEALATSEERIFAAQSLLERLAAALEVHNNRFSIQRLRDLFWVFYDRLDPKPQFRGASIIELGSGSHNPLSLLFVFVMLGAARAIAVDLEPIQEPARAFRAMARSAEAMLGDPQRLVGSYPISRTEIESNLAGFDLQKLREGLEEGIDVRRLFLMRESASKLPIDTASVDMVISNSFFEHIEDLDAVLREIARVTKPGGLSIHNIDGADHVAYSDPSRHPLEFLRVAQAGMVDECNRVRIAEFPALFERHGFEVRQVVPIERISVDAAYQQSFVSPWREMPREWIELVKGTVVARRV
jgi:SAM-dependent methyltransferase